MVVQLPVSLYVHIPWCVKKCPYCDFNSHVGGGVPKVNQAYQLALFNHLDAWLPWIEKRPIQSIFFGGGTPSLMSPRWYHEVMNRFAKLCQLSDQCEVTMEVNPGATEYGRFEDYRSAGINRLSFGVQSFEAMHLEVLGRIHGASEARDAVAKAANAGFERINVDLMYGLPNQSVSQAIGDLSSAMALPVSHISWYNLTIEPNTVFYSSRPKGLPDERVVCRQEAEGRRLLSEQGFVRYEVSAYAKSGQECRHNLGYWRSHDYVGIGAGAHGKLSDSGSKSIHRFQATRVPEHFMAQWSAPQDLEPSSYVETKDRPVEFMMNALRLRSGFSVEEFESAALIEFNEIKPVIDGLIEDKLLMYVDHRYVTSKAGYRHLDSVVAAFL